MLFVFMRYVWIFSNYLTQGDPHIMQNRLHQLLAIALIALFASLGFVQSTSAQSNQIVLSTVNLCINFGASCPDSDTLSVDIPEGYRISSAEARWISTGHFQPNEYSSVPTDNGTVSGHTFSATTGDIKALPLKGMTGSFQLTVVHDGRLDLLPPGSLDQAGSHRVDIYIQIEAIPTATPTPTATSTPTATPTLIQYSATADHTIDCSQNWEMVNEKSTPEGATFVWSLGAKGNLGNENEVVNVATVTWPNGKSISVEIKISRKADCTTATSTPTSTPTATLPALRSAKAIASADCAGVVTTTVTSVDSIETAKDPEFVAQNNESVLYIQRWWDSDQVLTQVIQVAKAENCAPPNTPREIVRAADVGMVASCAGLTTGITNIRNLRPGYLTDDVNSIVSPVWAGKKSIEEQTMFTPWSDARDYSWDIPSEGKTITIHGIRIRTVMVYSEDFGLPSPRTQERILMPFAVPSLEWFQSQGCFEAPTTITHTEETTSTITLDADTSTSFVCQAAKPEDWKTDDLGNLYDPNCSGPKTSGAETSSTMPVLFSLLAFALLNVASLRRQFANN